MSDAELIDALGGATKVAQALGLSRPQNVSNWKFRAGGIPPAHRPAVLVLARNAGLELDEAAFLRVPRSLLERTNGRAA